MMLSSAVTRTEAIIPMEIVRGDNDCVLENGMTVKMEVVVVIAVP
jgi:hypothetical protein